MKVISFDVGIKNLAYCLFDIPSLKSEKITILDWKVISLMETDEPIQRCNHEIVLNKKQIKKMNTLSIPANDRPNKNSKNVLNPTVSTGSTICNHLAKYKQTDIYLCDKHAKVVAANKTWILPETHFKKIKKMKMEEVVELATSFGFPTSLTKPKKQDVLDWIQDFLSKKCLIPISNTTKNAGEADLISLGHSMKKIFKDILPNDISCVLIENQISTLASRMKTVQGMLAQYFIMRYEDISVEFISSANKLKIFPKEKKPENPQEKKPENPQEKKPEGEPEKTKGQKYKEHKKDGVFYCEKVISDNIFLGGEQWGLIERKKKDDLADCFLQGVWWLKNKQHIE